MTEEVTEAVQLPIFDESRKGIRIPKRKTEKEETRKPLAYFSTSRFSIPEEIIKDNEGYILGWIAYQCRGEHMQTEIDDAIERGWWPVKKSECPSLARRYFSMDSNRKDDDLIIKGGQILMKRPLEDHQAELEFYSNMNKIHSQQIQEGLLTGRQEIPKGQQTTQQPAYLWQH